MLTNTQRLARLIIGGVLLVALFAAAFLVWDYHVKARDKVESHDFGSQIINYIRQGRYDVAGVHLFQDARSFEMAGDLSTSGRCAYYERARKLLEDRVPLLQGDHLTLEGRTYPLSPLRKENDKILAGVKGKAANAGCKS
jgi:hypothetical protein